MSARGLFVALFLTTLFCVLLANNPAGRHYIEEGYCWLDYSPKDLVR